ARAGDPGAGRAAPPAPARAPHRTARTGALRGSLRPLVRHPGWDDRGDRVGRDGPARGLAGYARRRHRADGRRRGPCGAHAQRAESALAPALSKRSPDRLDSAPSPAVMSGSVLRSTEGDPGRRCLGERSARDASIAARLTVASIDRQDDLAAYRTEPV